MSTRSEMTDSADITSQALIGFMVYVVVFFMLLMVHPSKFKRLVTPGAIMIAAVFFGLLGWAISSNGGTVGSLLSGKVPLSSTSKSFTMLYAISSGAGSSTAYASRISDWTRFAKTKNAPTLPFLLGGPFLGCLAPILGILATSAVYSRYEVILWNPLALLLYVQETQYTAGCRAATFFAGLSLFFAILMVSTPYHPLAPLQLNFLTISCLTRIISWGKSSVLEWTAQDSFQNTSRLDAAALS